MKKEKKNALASIFDVGDISDSSSFFFVSDFLKVENKKK
jgi:hypothetical protein